jgi:hypothetical protein
LRAGSTLVPRLAIPSSSLAACQPPRSRSSIGVPDLTQQTGFPRRRAFSWAVPAFELAASSHP